MPMNSPMNGFVVELIRASASGFPAVLKPVSMNPMLNRKMYRSASTPNVLANAIQRLGCEGSCVVTKPSSPVVCFLMCGAPEVTRSLTAVPFPRARRQYEF